MDKNYEIVEFKNGEFKLDVSVTPNSDTVWLNVNQMSKLFNKNTSADKLPHDGVVWYIFFVLDHIKEPDEFQHTHRFTVHLCFRFDRFQQRLRIFFKHR